ncbi:LPXTG cell wall anchor domain-containing protein [Kitasatospora sp. NPDC058048]|uniref:LPXTG cell wall anchor domain-containing protein n=1 Tax=Kitasatospora sp. NPDC058048 TaxID=3346313 RepID=UPI0036DBD92B
MSGPLVVARGRGARGEDGQRDREAAGEQVLAGVGHGGRGSRSARASWGSPARAVTRLQARSTTDAGVPPPIGPEPDGPRCPSPHPSGRPHPPHGQLPETGAENLTLVGTAGALLLAAGVPVLLTANRRRHPQSGSADRGTRPME